jgi:malate dehydrogenase
MSKVTVVGAGAVGASCANVLAINEIANEVVLLDIKEGFAEGKILHKLLIQMLLSSLQVFHVNQV